MHEGLYQKALKLRESKTVDATNYEAFKAGVEKGFVHAMWCGDEACEEQIKAETGATTRNMPFEQKPFSDVCVHCGKPAKYEICLLYTSRCV